MHLVTCTTITHKKNALQYLYLRLQDTLAESSVSVQCSAPVACEFYGTLSYATHFYATSSQKLKFLEDDDDNHDLAMVVKRERSPSNSEVS